MFTDEQWEDAEIVADDLREGNRAVFRGMAEELTRMVEERDLSGIPRILALIACLLPPEVQSRVRFGEN